MTAANASLAAATATRPLGARSVDASRHRLSRWHAVPVAAWLAERLAATRVRPVHVTLGGGALTALACATIAAGPHEHLPAAALVWLAWLCDRLDGALARRQGTVSRWGAWLDANLDELADVALHVAIAWQLAAAGATWPWLLVVAFVAGKYLYTGGVARERELQPRGEVAAVATAELSTNWFARVARAGGDADVRVHLLLAAVLTGWLGIELAAVACYYNARWMARYAIVAQRLAGGRA